MGVPVERVRAFLTGEAPVTWVFTGDSVTKGGGHLHGCRDYTQLFAERVRAELGRSADVVINTAVGGRDVNAVADDADRAILRFHPDVVVIGLGLNDSRGEESGVAAFTDRYRALCRTIVEAGGLPVLQTPNGATAMAAPFVLAHLDAYTEAIRGLADELALPLVDHATDWRAAAEREVLEQWIGHGCHPNNYGHVAMAHTLLRAIDIFDPASPTGRLYVP